MALLEHLRITRGLPEWITVDYAPEFQSRALDAWAHQHDVHLQFSRPRKPVDNTFIEAFHGRLRDECLNQSWFLSLADARHTIAVWRDTDNTARPHRGLAGRTPSGYAAEYQRLMTTTGLSAWDRTERGATRQTTADKSMPGDRTSGKHALTRGCFSGNTILLLRVQTQGLCSVQPQDVTNGRWAENTHHACQRKMIVILLLLGSFVLSSCQQRLSDRPLSYWESALRSGNPRARYDAAVAISRAAPQSAMAIHLLLGALEDERLASVHNVLAEVRATIGPRAARAAPRLARQLHDEHTQMRLSAVLALGRIGTAVPASIAALASALGDSDHEVRITVVPALAHIGPPARATAPALARLVNGPIGTVRLDVLNALERIMSPNHRST